MVLLEDAIKYYASEANCCLTKLIFLTKAACLSLQERQTTFVRMSHSNFKRAILAPKMGPKF